MSRSPRASCLLGGLVEVGAELGEGGQLAVLGELEAQGAGDLLHRLDLGGAADPGDRDADVDRRPHAGEEEVRLQEDLPVGDGDDVGGDVGGDVPGLGLDDGQGGERPAALVVGELGGALEQAAVEVEHVAGVGLASRRPAQQQRELPVGDRLLGEVVVDDEGVHPVVAEVLAHGAAGVGGEELERRRVRGVGGHDDGVVHRPVLLQLLDHLGHGGLLLADGHVDAEDVGVLLVDDGVDGDGGLAGLAVADDQLALAAADGHQGVEGLEAGLHRLVDRLAEDDARGLHLDAAGLAGLDGALAVQRVAQGVDHPAAQRLAHRDAGDLAGALDRGALADGLVVAHDGDADVVLLEVEDQAPGAVVELDQLAGQGVGQAIDAGDAVAHGQDRAGLVDLDLLAVVLDLLFDDPADLVGANFHGCVVLSARARRRAAA